MNKPKLLSSSIFGALVILLLAAFAQPAQGAKSGESLDALRATDREIEKAIADLDAQIKTQEAELAAANQAYDAAMQAVQQIDDNLKGATDSLEAIRSLVRGRALAEYMAPRDDEVSQLLNADGFIEASRRNELIRQLANSDGDALDEMKAIKKDIDQQRKIADDARKLAGKRKAEAEKKLAELNAAREEQKKAEKILQDRIQAALEEDLASGFDGTDAGGPNGKLRFPVGGKAPVTSEFGSRWGRLHAGIDIGIPVGTPVVAAHSGKVTFSGPASGYGNLVCIEGANNLMTCYGHLSRFLVKVGDTVGSGKEIAKSGNTGRSTGAHLHFETCRSGGKQACFFSKAYENPRRHL